MGTVELWKRRAVKTVVAVVALILASSFAYHYVVVVFEGRSPSYWNSLRTVVETYTGTGYGADSPWDSAVANVFVTAMDLSTFLLLFVVVPYVFRPVLDEALSPDVPYSVDASDHTVVCGYTERTRELVSELESRGVEHVVLVEDEDEAVELVEQGVSVVCGDPTSTEALDRAALDQAASVVVDTEDAESASVVLAGRDVDSGVRVVVLVRDPGLERYLRYAGADVVLTPRRLLGRRIAERIRGQIDPLSSDAVTVDDDLGLVEVAVSEDSPVCGMTLGSSGVVQRDSVWAAGVWRDGEFQVKPSGDVELSPHTTLLMVGEEDALEDVESLVYGRSSPEASVVVAGYGEVGSTVSESLELSGVDCAVVDVEGMEGVDVVGDATEDDVLRESGLEDAAAFVCVIQDDSDALLSVLVAREISSDVDVVARVNDSDNEGKMRRAGADYVLSLPEISGRLLASEVLREEVLSVDRQFKVVRVDGDAFEGEMLADTALAELDVVVVSVERDGDTYLEVGSEFVFEAGDEVLVAGRDDGVEELRRRSRPG